MTTETFAGDELEEFRSISPAEFFYRNRQMAGFGNPTQALYTTVRELVENSLDSCEEAGVLPDIDVHISTSSRNTCVVSVADNGSGISESRIADAFGRVLYGSKYDNRQRRGTFGLGVSLAILYGQITTGSPATVHTRDAGNEGREFRIFIDVESNSPIVESSRIKERTLRGTSVSITLNGDLKRARERIIEYLRLSGISTPHATIKLRIEGLPEYSFGGFTKTLPPRPATGLPHPRAADVELLQRLIAKNPNLSLHQFLVKCFQQIGKKTAHQFLTFIGMNSKMSVESLDRNSIRYLSENLRNYDGFSKPNSESLSPIGERSFVESIKNEFESPLLSYSTRGPFECNGFPTIIEGVLLISKKIDASEGPVLYRFANRVPLLYDSTDDIFARVVKKVPWSNYTPPDIGGIALFTHICSTRIPYSAAGKQAVASVNPLSSEILSLYRELGRHLRSLTAKRTRTLHAKRRMKEFTNWLKLLAKFSGDLADVDSPPDITQMIERHFEVNMDV